MSFTIRLDDDTFSVPVPIKFIIKASGTTPDEAFKQASQWHFPKKNIIEGSIVIRQVDDNNWEVEGVYYA